MEARGSRRLVGAVLGGERGDLARCVASLKKVSVQVELFDTTADRRHRRLQARGVNVTALSWRDSFAEVRNAALESMCGRNVGDVVLWLDSDEWLVDEAVRPVLESEDIRLTPRVAYCPTISDPDHDTTGVARLHALEPSVRFVGAVHEYLVGPDGPLEHRPVALRIGHEGYANWDRSRRNGALLRRQIEAEPESPRWRPFWVRDAGSRSAPAEIAQAIREQARTDPIEVPMGGLGTADYTRLIAWHGSFHLLRRSAPALLWAALSRLGNEDRDLESELLYLRTVASVKAGKADDRLAQRLAEVRRESLAEGREFPWLDAAVCITLDAQGRRGEADAYRAECELYTDPFCEDSRLRTSVVDFRTS